MTIVAANGIRICGRYTLLGKLGEGGEGEVWRARDHEQGREVALKILRPEIARRPGKWEALKREHEISSRLDHPLILKVDPPVRDGDVVALPMDLAPDGDLRRLCGVSYLEIVPVLLEVAQALAHAHERGIVHRDLKPANILFDARGHVRIADFGGAHAGLSPFTASPQQLRGEPPTAADDIYGLGALAYELLSGHPPYYPRFDARRALEEPVPPLRPAHLAPDRLVSLVMTMLAKRAADRPASMSEVIDALDAGLNDTLPFTYDEPPDALASSSDTQPQLHLSDAEISPAEQAPRTRAANPARVVAERVPDAPRPAASTLNAASAATSAPVVHAAPVVKEAPASTPRPAAAARHAETIESVERPRSQERTPPPHGAQPSERRDPASSAARRAHPSEHEAAAAAAPLRAERAVPDPELRAMWADIKVERVPNLMKLEPVRRSRWPWTLAAGMAAVAIAVFFLLHESVGGHSWTANSLAQLRSMTSPAMVQTVRGAVEAPLRAMAARHGTAATADAGQATDAGSAPTAARPASEGRVQGSGQAHSSEQTHAGSSEAAAAQEPRTAPARALPPARVPRAAGRQPARSAAPGAAGSGETAASSLSPRAAAGAGAARSPQAAASALPSGDSSGSTASLPSASGSSAAGSAATAYDEAPASHTTAAIRALLQDGRAAEAAHDYAHAAQDYSQALALDSGDAAARAGLQRANAAFGAGEYAQAVGAGFAALGAGRLEEARADFERARGIDHTRGEAERGLKRVSAALRVRDAAQSRSRARADLESRLEAIIDDPQSLASASVRTEAASLIRQADAAKPASVVLSSLSQRLAILLPSYDKPVHLALVSDNVTQVEIPQIGSFGTFSRREIDLKPGRYTVIGTRPGYRDVRRDVTVVPGPDVQTISVRCEQPI